MASGSCLTIKQGLLWNVRNRQPFRTSMSPEFVFLNSIWRVEIDIKFDRITTDLMFNITLRNACKFQPPLSFHVTTFLEDNVNENHMMCSRVTVFSSDAILYKESFDVLCGKLPNFNMDNNLIILFLFSASTDLGLNLKREISSPDLGSIFEKKVETSESSLNIVRCLIWDSKVPRRGSQTSPFFSLQNSRWKLELHLANSQTPFYSAYQLCLKYYGDLPSIPTIVVKTFLDHREFFVQYKLSSRSEGTSSNSDTVHKARFDSIAPDADGFQYCNDVSVICIFHPSDDLALIEAPKRETPVLLECSLCQNSGCFSRDYVNNPPPPNSEHSSTILSPNLPSLSQDLTLLLDTPLMPDVQLVCKEVRIPAHMAILAARSQFLKRKIAAMSKNNFDINQIINVSEVELSMLQLLLKYLYSGEIPDVLSEDKIYRLYILSCMYEVESLRRMCRCFFARNLREDNYVNVMLLVKEHNDTELRQAIILFVTAGPQIRQSDSWENFKNNFPQTAEEINNVLLQQRLPT